MHYVIASSCRPSNADKFVLRVTAHSTGKSMIPDLWAQFVALYQNFKQKWGKK